MELKLVLFYLLVFSLPLLSYMMRALITKQIINNIIYLAAFLLVLVAYHYFWGPLPVFALYIFLLLGSVLLGQKNSLVVVLCNVVFLAAVLKLEWNQIMQHVVYFSVIAFLIGEFIERVKAELKSTKMLNINLSHQVKELRALREISAILQGALELEKVLHIILSAVTAGYGLEFNRAILFLVDGDINKLKGKIGIGPLNREEGWQNWQRVASDKLLLEDMLELQEEVETSDQELNEIIRNLKFDLAEEHLGAQVIKNQESYKIDNIDPQDRFQSTLAAKLDVRSFAVVPLIVKGEAIGALCVDNIVNGEEITYDDIDSLLPFANQAALAIHNAQLHELKEEMAVTDNLTGLYNQRFFQRSLKKELERAQANEQNLGLLMLDIDHFKAYNDNNGHPLGNQALAKLARILQESFRPADIICRFGGEEFVVLLPEVTKEELVKIAERTRQKVAEAEFENQAQQPSGNLTVSIGAALFSEDATTSHQLLQTADEMLYGAKEAGRNTVNYKS